MEIFQQDQKFSNTFTWVRGTDLGHPIRRTRTRMHSHAHSCTHAHLCNLMHTHVHSCIYALLRTHIANSCTLMHTCCLPLEPIILISYPKIRFMALLIILNGFRCALGLSQHPTIRPNLGRLPVWIKPGARLFTYISFLCFVSPKVNGRVLQYASVLLIFS